MDKIYVVANVSMYVSGIEGDRVRFVWDYVNAKLFGSYKQAYNLKKRCERRGDRVFVDVIHKQYFIQPFWNELVRLTSN